MKTRLSDYVSDYLVRQGIDTCFTVTGGGAMFLNDSFGHQKNLSCIYNHHEQACAMAAEAYARLKNKPAILCVTTGPGGTNALTGVLGAYLDSLPMIVISGQVRYDTTARYNNKFTKHKLRSVGDQEFDIVETASTMCKYATMLEKPEDILYILQKALFEATTGRPGPVWIDIPLNFQSAIIETDNLKQYKPDISKLPKQVSDKTINKIIEKINKAERPVLYAGNGIRIAGAVSQFNKMVKKLNIPVVTYWDSIDLIETDNPLYVGRAGNMGDRPGNFAVQNSDLLLVIGNRLSIRNVGFNFKSWARKAEVIMVDIDKAELEKPTIHVEMPVWADAKDFIAKINDNLPNKLIRNNKWHDICLNWKNKYPVVLPKHKNDKDINVYHVFDYLSKNLKEKTVTVTSNGSCCVVGHQTWYIKKGSRFLNNNAVASMGYGLPASIGACIANNRKEVICLEGDGSIMMNLQELQTIITNKLPIKIVLINNEGYHSIRQSQSRFFKDHTRVGIGPESHDLSFPDFSKVIKAFGIPYIQLRNKKDFKKRINEFINYSGFVVLEIFVSKDQEFEPKSSSKQLLDGTIVSPPLEDLYPFLSEEELKENMYIELIEE